MSGFPPNQHGGRGRPILGQGAVFPDDEEAYAYLPHPQQQYYMPPDMNYSVPPPAAVQSMPSYNNYPQYESVMNSSSLSVNAAEFVPRFLPSAPVEYYPPAANPVKETQKALTDVVMSSGNIEDILDPLIRSLSQSVKDEQMMSKVVDEIFEKGVSEPNFRYHAAKMCGYLSSNLTCQFPGGNFRSHLLKRCQADHKQREELMADDTRRHLLIGFTIFMGELFLNVTVGNEGQKMKILCTALQELLSTLMSQPTEPSLGCVVQVLKLTGACLEDLEKEENEANECPNMDSVFRCIKKNIVESDYRRSTKRQLLSVVELRASRWGRREEAAANTPAAANPASQTATPGAYYSEGSQNFPSYDDRSAYPEITPEEEAAAYYQQQQEYGGGEGPWQQQQQQQQQNSQYYSQFSNESFSSQDGGMDAETEAAYEQFLEWQQTSLNNNANRY